MDTRTLKFLLAFKEACECMSRKEAAAYANEVAYNGHLNERAAEFRAFKCSHPEIWREYPENSWYAAWRLIHTFVNFDAMTSEELAGMNSIFERMDKFFA